MNFEEQQQHTADQLGTTVDEMNRIHDPLHRATAKWLGTTSHSLRVAQGETLTAQELELAYAEEAAIMALQKWVHMAKLEVPTS
jgi:hypothetical protein